ncbi:MAG: WG repeat-containing protein [bacterium]
MRLKVILFFILFLPAITANSGQTGPYKPLAAYKIDSMWYFVNYDGNQIFAPKKLNNVLGYSEGFYCVSVMINNNEKWGYLDSTGKFIIEPKYDVAQLFSEGFATVYEFPLNLGEPSLISYINRNGKPINKDTLIDAISFSEGYGFVFTKNGKSGYIDTSGDFVIDLKELVGNKFSEDLAVVTNYDLFAGFINKKGEIVIPVQFESAKKFSEGLAPVNKNSKYNFINKQGEFVITGDFDVVHNFNEGIAFVGDFYPKSLMTLWGFIDKSGKLIQDYKYNAVWDFSEGTAAVRDSLYWGFIDKKGNYIIEPVYTYASGFIDGFAWASKKDEEVFGYINKQADYIIKFDNFEKLIDLRLNKRMY